MPGSYALKASSEWHFAISDQMNSLLPAGPVEFVLLVISLQYLEHVAAERDPGCTHT